MKLPKSIRQAVEHFERLPGVGPKSAQRLVFYLLHNPENRIKEFADALIALKRDTKVCSVCHLVGQDDPCEVCTDGLRDKHIMCIVEQPLDALAIERSETYQGLYHVLHGAISPLQNIGPDQLYLRDVLGRLDGVKEIIIATNPTMEGEATALYLVKLIEESAGKDSVSITRIGHGLPIGANIEYADGKTLSRALEGRRVM